jgi:hypothetical protein
MGFGILRFGLGGCGSYDAIYIFTRSRGFCLIIRELVGGSWPAADIETYCARLTMELLIHGLRYKGNA